MTSRPETFEDTTRTLRGRCRADDGIRTRDPHLGKVMRYQLRYVRIHSTFVDRHDHRPPRASGTLSDRSTSIQIGVPERHRSVHLAALVSRDRSRSYG